MQPALGFDDDRRWLFLPFKKKADATPEIKVDLIMRCFYLSKRRQMQPTGNSKTSCAVVFTFQKEGRCNRQKQNDACV